jgi:hypothetical protein
MAAPNNVQRAVLKNMPDYCIVMQWTRGALMVAPDGNYQDVKVIDIDGHVYSFSYYMSICDRRLKRPSVPTSSSWRADTIPVSVASLRFLSPLGTLFRSFSARILASLKR